MSTVIYRAGAAILLVFWATACSDDAADPDGSGGASTSSASSSTGSVTSGAPSSNTASSATSSSAGQGGAGGEGTGGAPPLPEKLVLTGEAQGMSPDLSQTVTCALDGELTEMVLQGDVIEGMFVGEFGRLVEEPPEAFLFEPFIGGPASVTRQGGAMASLRLVGDQPPDAKPYWVQLEVLTAVEVAPFEFEGTFRCAPLEIDGNPPDFTTSAEGTFRLAPP